MNLHAPTVRGWCEQRPSELKAISLVRIDLCVEERYKKKTHITKETQKMWSEYIFRDITKETPDLVRPEFRPKASSLLLHLITLSDVFSSSSSSQTLPIWVPSAFVKPQLGGFCVKRRNVLWGVLGHLLYSSTCPGFVGVISVLLSTSHSILLCAHYLMNPFMCVCVWINTVKGFLRPFVLAGRHLSGRRAHNWVSEEIKCCLEIAALRKESEWECVRWTDPLGAICEIGVHWGRQTIK